jgi:Tfp pilus assembly protein PilN
VKAVNLIPKDARRGRGPAPGISVSPAYVVLGLMAVALVFVVVYVLTSNTISNRKAQLATVQAQLTTQQAEAARLAKYVQFESLAQTRVQTVRDIAAARFNWYQALTDLSKVVPANTSLATLTGTVAPGASAGGTAGGSASSLRGDLAVPAFELTGCTKSQDDVARLMSRLRVMHGVTRVTLGNSQKPGTNGAGSAVSASGQGGCGPNAPTFDLIVFFQPLPGAGPTGVTSVTSQTGAVASPQPGTATTPQTTTAAPAAPTASGTSTATPASATAPASPATPASTATPAATAASASSGGSK